MREDFYRLQYLATEFKSNLVIDFEARVLHLGGYKYNFSSMSFDEAIEHSYAFFLEKHLRRKITDEILNNGEKL